MAEMLFDFKQPVKAINIFKDRLQHGFLRYLNKNKLAVK